MTRTRRFREKLQPVRELQQPEWIENDTAGSSGRRRLRGTLQEMYDNDHLDNVVLFDVPLDSDLLCDRLQEDRLVWMHVRDGETYVAAALRPEPEDLAVLLRSVEAWIVGRGLWRLSYELDGRSYVLRAQPELAPAAG
jgi:hypothetical protein